jgi:hypothetical protein
MCWCAPALQAVCAVKSRPSASLSKWMLHRHLARILLGRVLTDAGFQFLGEWTHDPESLLQLDAKASGAPRVYAFVVDDIVVYVGLTLSGLKIRLDQYRRGHKGQKTSSRINGRISQTLHEGKRVKVLVATPEPTEWQELPVNTAAALEAGLIEMIRPAWNRRGAG